VVLDPEHELRNGERHHPRWPWQAVVQAVGSRILLQAVPAAARADVAVGPQHVRHVRMQHLVPPRCEEVRSLLVHLGHVPPAEAVVHGRARSPDPRERVARRASDLGEQAGVERLGGAERCVTWAPQGHHAPRASHRVANTRL